MQSWHLQHLPPCFSSMLHLFLFLFDKSVSIKAFGSNRCTTRPSVEMSKSVTLQSTEGTKNSLCFSSLFPSLHFFFQMHWTNKAVSLAQKYFKEHGVCWECFRNVEQCWLLSFASQRVHTYSQARCWSFGERAGPRTIQHTKEDVSSSFLRWTIYMCF